MKALARILSVLLLTATTACMKWDYGLDGEEEFATPARGLFILNEGNFQYGNATLSFYDPTTNKVDNEVFFRANAMKLGDVAQSMEIYGNRGWIVVNNSRVVFAIDLTTFREVGRIENLTSPRYIHFVSPTKAYVTQLWDNRIFIVNPLTYEITGHITVPDMAPGSGSTEQMVAAGRYVYCNCWSYQNRVIRIDTETDRVDASLEVGIQPNSLAIDRNGKLWVLTDGGFEGNPLGSEAPVLVRIDPDRFEIEARFEFALGDSPSELQLNGTGDMLYWLNNDVCRMAVTASSLPASPFLANRNTMYYGLTVDPDGGDVYVADAIDYQQPGKIYRYSSRGELKDEFYVGVNPGAYCWK